MFFVRVVALMLRGSVFSRWIEQPGHRRCSAILAALALLVASACGGDRSPTTPTPTVTPAAQLSVQGDPEAPQGASWTYRGVFEGVTFDLQGILLKPQGAGPF